jgi:hypothetical protein
VNTDEVNVTAITLLHKGLQPIQTHAVGAVGHGGRAKVHFILEGFCRLHVVFPRSDGVGDGNAGAACAGSDITSSVNHHTFSYNHSKADQRRKRKENKREGNTY